MTPWKNVALMLTVCMLGHAAESPDGVASVLVFVNELHYDNAGADAGEFIEIAGPADTNLSGWNLVLYNGNDRSTYGTIDLTGIIDNEANSGFGALTFPKSGIQNGAPDGIALIDDSSNVVQFLSYEGSFEAADGPASGLTSTGIGVSESSSTPVGNSLQLIGAGSEWSDFVWSGPAVESPGSINSGQTYLRTIPEPMSLLIWTGITILVLGRAAQKKRRRSCR